MYVTKNAAYSWQAAVQESVDATLNRTVSSGTPILRRQACDCQDYRVLFVDLSLPEMQVKPLCCQVHLATWHAQMHSAIFRGLLIQAKAFSMRQRARLPTAARRYQRGVLL